jgi:hypothetical protein
MRRRDTNYSKEGKKNWGEERKGVLKWLIANALQKGNRLGAS